MWPREPSTAFQKHNTLSTTSRFLNRKGWYVISHLHSSCVSYSLHNHEAWLIWTRKSNVASKGLPIYPSQEAPRGPKFASSTSLTCSNQLGLEGIGIHVCIVALCAYFKVDRTLKAFHCCAVCVLWTTDDCLMSHHCWISVDQRTVSDTSESCRKRLQRPSKCLSFSFGIRQTFLISLRLFFLSSKPTV